MMLRRGAERKAATQALQVIAESIRACKGRGGTIRTSDNLNKHASLSLVRSQSEIVQSKTSLIQKKKDDPLNSI